MLTVISGFALIGAVIWIGTLLSPWLPWSTRESLEAEQSHASVDLSDVTVLIPARNEADVIKQTVQAVVRQGQGIGIVIVDDHSTDNTAEIAQSLGISNLRIVRAAALPEGWTGKLWALEQGRQHITTPLMLLLDADIVLDAGIIQAMRDKMSGDNRQFISLMAWLRMDNLWEKWLMPAFIFFFKLLYPFRIANSNFKGIAAAAGGCILLETRVIETLGGFGVLRDALIDDCTLAKRVKQSGFRTWMGLTKSIHSMRPYSKFVDIQNMVARTAFTQLQYSTSLLLLCTALLFAGAWAPLLGMIFLQGVPRWISAAGVAAMLLCYLPILRYYARSPLWAFSMPLIATVYLYMTWLSALRYWRGVRSAWKDREYSVRKAG